MSEAPEQAHGAAAPPPSVGPITLTLREIRQGNEKAVAVLFDHVHVQLTRMARQLLRDHPAVQAKEEADDIVSQLWQRLERALLPCDPANSRKFFRVANLKMGQLLTDLSRRYKGPGAVPLGKAAGTEAHDRAEVGNNIPGGPPNQGTPTWISETEQVWLLLEAVDRLEESDRELVQYSYYQEMTAPEIAEVLDVDEKTIDRRLQRLRGTLRGLMEQVIADAGEKADE